MMDYSGLDDDSDEQNEGGRALELKFSIGYNSAMRAAVHNLTITRSDSKKTKEIFYPSAHTGVIYDYHTCEAKLLQGHVRIKILNLIFLNIIKYSVMQ